MLTLGIPGNPAIAMIFAALLIQGVTPGPFLIKEHPDLFWAVIASMYIGNVMLLVLNLPLVGLWVQMLKVPYSILAPFIVLICSIGVYSMKNNVDRRHDDGASSASSAMSCASSSSNWARSSWPLSWGGSWNDPSARPCS